MIHHISPRFPMELISKISPSSGSFDLDPEPHQAQTIMESIGLICRRTGLSASVSGPQVTFFRPGDDVSFSYSLATTPIHQIARKVMEHGQL